MAVAPRPARRLALPVIAVVGATAAVAALLLLRTTDPGAGRAGARPPRAAGRTSVGLDTPLGATDVKIDIARLISELLADEPATLQRYQLKTVEVTGTLLDIERADPELITLIVGKQLGSRESPCACQARRGALEQVAAGLTRGQPITVRGAFAGLSMMRVVLLSCEIVR